MPVLGHSGLPGPFAAQSGRAQLTSTRTPGRVAELTEGEWLVLGCPLVQGWPEPQPIPPGLPGRVAPTGGPRRGCLLLPPGRLLVKTNPAERGPGVGEGRASARRNSISHHERARSQDRPREQRAVGSRRQQEASSAVAQPAAETVGLHPAWVLKGARDPWGRPTLPGVGGQRPPTPREGAPAGAHRPLLPPSYPPGSLGRTVMPPADSPRAGERLGSRVRVRLSARGSEPFAAGEDTASKRGAAPGAWAQGGHRQGAGSWWEPR